MSSVTTYTDLTGNKVKLSPSLIEQYLVSGSGKITSQEAMMFLMMCKNRQLNPFNKEAHLIKYSDKAPATMVVGKDAFTQRAAAHSDFDGMRAGIVINTEAGLARREGSMKLTNEQIVGGWAEVFRKSWSNPIKAEVAYHEYEAKRADGKPNATWSKMGATMIRKVALVQALREAFPDQFSGLYESAEMSQSTNAVDVEQVVTESQVKSPPDQTSKAEATTLPDGELTGDKNLDPDDDWPESFHSRFETEDPL